MTQSAVGLPGLYRIPVRAGVDEILLDEAFDIGWGGNGGFQAINIATRFGSSRILLVGFDYTLESGVHWHGSHRSPLVNPSEAAVSKWRRILDDQAPALEAAGIEVINCSPISRLTAFRRADLLESLKCP